MQVLSVLKSFEQSSLEASVYLERIAALSRTNMRLIVRTCIAMVWVLAFFLALEPRWTVAQTVNGSFRGMVTDQTGGTVPGAVVRATNTGTGISRQARTDTAGSYVLPDMRPGVYDFTVSSPGFSTVENRGVILLVNQVATLDFTLRPGAVKQEVTVRAQAPLANLSNSTVSTVIESQEVNQLPLNGRQFTQLILLSPGAAPQSSGQQGFFEVHSDYGAVSPAVNGTRPEMNNFTIDGVENNELFFDFAAINPPPDAIQEFNVQTDMSSGQYGRAAGANVNVATKTGTNELHGNAWEFLRNTSLDARNFFSPSVSTFHQNQFGATLGGPIKKDKVWAFGWYEGFRKDLGSTILGLVPTAAQLGGDLSGLPQIYNPFTTRQVGTSAQGTPVLVRDPFLNNQIPSAILNSTALAVAKFVYPIPNYSGVGVNHLDSEPVVTNTNQFGTRIDAALSERTNLFGRFAWDDSSRTLPSGIPSEPTFQRQLDVQQILGLTHTFNPSSVLDLRSQFLRTSIGLLGNFPSVSFLASNGLLRDWPAETGLRPVMPSFTIAGIQGVPGVAQSLPGKPINNWEETGTFTKIAGRHTIGAGASVMHTWVLDNCTYASASFDNLPTNDPQNPSTTGAGLASYLLGLPSAATDLRGTAQMLLHGNYYGSYVDDVWKATPKLTVNLGLRYDYASPLQEEQGREASLDYAHSTPTDTIWLDVSRNPLSGAQPNVPNGFFLPDHDNWAPRVALAYRLPHDAVIRSGYGIFYDFNQSNVQDTQDIMGQWPFGLPDITSTDLNAPSVTNPAPTHILGVAVFPPFVPTPTPPANPGFAANRYNQRPMVQDWDLAIDKSFGNDWLVSATYLGSKGTFVQISPVINVAATPGPGNPQLRARLPQFAPFEITADWGNSNFEAGELKVEKRYSQGLAFIASYTWSKSMDYQSATHGSAQPGEGIQNGLNFRGDYAVSDFNVPQNFVFSTVYELPVGQGKRFLSGKGRLMDSLLGGWQVTGILTLHSGFPFGVYLPFDNANTGGGAFGSLERPSLVGSLFPAGFQQSVQHWFNTSALMAVPFQYGTLGRNVLTQDGVQNLDFGLFKHIKLTENKRIEFRAESFDLFNTPFFAAPDGNFSDTTFGQVLSAANPRFIQFGLKFLF